MSGYSNDNWKNKVASMPATYAPQRFKKDLNEAYYSMNERHKISQEEFAYNAGTYASQFNRDLHYSRNIPRERAIGYVVAMTDKSPQEKYDILHNGGFTLTETPLDEAIKTAIDENVGSVNRITIDVDALAEYFNGIKK